MGKLGARFRHRITLSGATPREASLAKAETQPPWAANLSLKHDGEVASVLGARVGTPSLPAIPIISFDYTVLLRQEMSYRTSGIYWASRTSALLHIRILARGSCTALCLISPHNLTLSTPLQLS